MSFFLAFITGTSVLALRFVDSEEWIFAFLVQNRHFSTHFMLNYLQMSFFFCNFAAESSKGEDFMSVQKHSLAKKQLLSKQLYDSGYLWSYKAIGDDAVLTDEELILNGLSHLEFEDMSMLFEAFPYRQIKQVWQQRMLPYPDYYGVLNLLLAALFFHIKSPKKYTAKYVA